MEWTEAQHRAIHSHGTNLLVSAAAGSGKTSVLAERCCALVIKDQGCRIDQLLVMTFAEEAAAEMKHRIEARLVAHAQQAAQRGAGNADYLRRQALLAPAAHISTIHAFCARLIRQNFHLAGVDPAFRVLDGEESALLQREVVEALFEEHFETDPMLRELVDLYGDGSDLHLRERVVQTSNTLRSILDAEGWKAGMLARLEEAGAAARLDESAIGREFITLVRETLTQAQTLAAAAVEYLEGLEGFAESGRYGIVAANLRAAIDGWMVLLQQGEFDAVVQAAATDLDDNLRGKCGIPAAERAIAKTMLDDLRKMLRKGDLAQYLALSERRLMADLAGTVPFVRAFLVLSTEFEQRYQAEKRQSNALDFSDLEHTALALLGRCENGQYLPSDLARRLHQQYLHVLVDEYQDINPVQEQILKYVSRECLGAANAGNAGNAGNLFCVGDVKQSIYRFRLAAPDIFQDRLKRYKAGQGGKAIPLSENFRSRKPLLEAINRIFETLMCAPHAEIAYEDGHALLTTLQHAQVDAGFRGTPVELHLVQKDLLGAPGADREGAREGEGEGEEAHDAESCDEEDMEEAEMEAAHVAALIRGWLQPADGVPRQVLDKDQGFRDLCPGDIVVLLRSIKHRTREYARVFAEYGIPLRSESRSGFFAAVEVQDVLSVLRLLDNQQQDIYLAAVLRSPIAGLPHPEDAMARIRLQYRGCPFHLAVGQYASECTDTLAEHLRALLLRLAGWRELALQQPVAELIATICRETHLPAWYAALANGPQRLANLQYLQQCAARFAGFQRQGLYRFLNYLEELEEKDSLSQPPAMTDNDAVRLMSIHASKGLEFPVVIAAGLGRRMNMQDRNETLLLHREKGIALRVADKLSNTRYPSIATRLIERQMICSTLAEELRILYVALTRAKEHLVLVGTCSSKQVQRWSLAPLAGGEPIDSAQFLRCSSFLHWLAPLFAGAGAGESAGALKLLPIAELAPPLAAAPATAEASTTAETTAIDGAVQRAIARLSYRYAHTAQTVHPAAFSVTALSKHELPAPSRAPAPSPAADAAAAAALAPVPVDADGEVIEPATVTLEGPRHLAAGPVAGDLAAARGTATHRVLQHLDFTRAADELRAQIGEMVQRCLLSPCQAELVDLDSLRWLLATELGALMRASGKQLLREVPLLDSAAPPEDSAALGLDRFLLRGRIDALLPSATGWLVIDYKTDRVLPAEGSERALAYQKQVQIYRSALEHSGLGQVTGVRLVFLQARAIVQF